MKKERAKSDWKCAYCGTPSIITMAHQIEDLNAKVAMAETAMRGAMQLATEVEAERDALKERVRVLEETMHAIGDACHELSSGPEVPDTFWDLRCTAYSALAGGKEGI